MSSERVRSGFIPVVLVTLCMNLLGGCNHVEAATLMVFVADLLRNAAAALLL